jgi:MFS transporter, DHA3 family, tetracycline resistance protein
MALDRNKRGQPVRVYYLYTILTNLLFTTVFSVNMVYQVQTARLTPLQLVLVGTVLELSVLLFEIPTGVVADVYSRRLSIIIGTWLIGLGFVTESLFPAFVPILIAQVLWGVGYTFTSGAVVAWLTDEVGQESVQNLLMRGAQWEQIGAIIATFAAVGLASLRLNLPIFLAGCGFGGLGLYLILQMPEDGFRPLPPEERKTWKSMSETVRQGFSLLKASRLLIYLIIIAFFTGFYSEGFDRLWTPHFLHDLAFPAYLGLQPVVWFGVMTVIGSLLTLGATEWIRRSLQNAGSQILFRVMFTSTVLLVFNLVVFALVKVLWVIVAAWLFIYMLRRAVVPAYTIWYNEHLNSRVRATMLSFSGQVDSFGQVIGGPPIGLIGDLINIPAALLASAVMLIPALVFYMPLLKQENLNRLRENSPE